MLLNIVFKFISSFSTCHDTNAIAYSWNGCHLSDAFVFDEDLASWKSKISSTEGILLPLRMIGLAYVELLLRAANVRAASSNISAESDPLHRLASTGRDGLTSLRWCFLNTTKINSNSLHCCHLPENFPLNIRNYTVHHFSLA